MYAPRTKTPQARAEYCWQPSAPTRCTLGQASEDAAAEDLNLRVRFYGRGLVPRIGYKIRLFSLYAHRFVENWERLRFAGRVNQSVVDQGF